MFIEIHFTVKISLEIMVQRMHNTWSTHYF